MAPKKADKPNGGSKGKGQKAPSEAKDPNHRTVSNSPAGSTTSSMQTTIARSSTHSASAQSSDGPEEVRETILARLAARLKEIKLAQTKEDQEPAHPTGPVASLPKDSEDEVVVNGFLLVKQKNQRRVLSLRSQGSSRVRR